jgi:hypothetical protein
MHLTIIIGRKNNQALGGAAVKTENDHRDSNFYEILSKPFTRFPQTHSV